MFGIANYFPKISTNNFLDSLLNLFYLHLRSSWDGQIKLECVFFLGNVDFYLLSVCGWILISSGLRQKEQMSHKMFSFCKWMLLDENF